MNAELLRRLREHASPFDGATWSSPPDLPAVVLRKSLAAVVEDLRSVHEASVLFTLLDSYAVDGLLATSRTTSWGALAASLVADQRLFIACSGERDVYTAILPQDYCFYLRFYMNHEIAPGCPLEGRFDVTVGADGLDAFAAQLGECGLERGAGVLRRVVPWEYFVGY